MYLKRHLCICLLVLCSTVLSKEVRKHKKPYSNLKKQRSVRDYDTIVSRTIRDLSVHAAKEKELKNMCKEFCEHVEKKESKTGIIYKKFDPNQNLCSCINKQGNVVKRKMFKSDSSESPQPVINQNEKEKLQRDPLVTLHRGHFSCNESEVSQKKCKSFCHKHESFGCSKDGSECLCFGVKDRSKKVLERQKRQMIAETIMDNGEHVIGMSVNPPHRTRRPQGYGGYGGGHHHGHHGQNYGPHSMAPGCTPYTCLDECPYGCDSLCRQNVECFCSCPEDISYDYYDDSFPSFF